MRFHELFEYRRDVTVDTYSGKLKKISSNDPEETLKEIEKGDPSFHKIYVLWIIKQLHNKLIKLEDMSRTHEMLSSYNDLKKHLPIEQRDMNKFTYHELYDIVNIDSTATQTLDIEGVDDDEYKLIHNSPLGTLVIPKTENAACVLGKRTSWCTATKTSDNYFDDHGKDETLYIWLDKIHNQKYQFHFESVEFKDSKDIDIDWDILKNWRNNHPVLKGMFKEGEKRLGLDAGYNIPQSTILYVQAVIKHQLATDDVERKFLRTADIDSIIKYVPYSSTDRIIDNAVIDQIYKYQMSVSSGVRYNEEVRQNERWPELEKLVIKHYNTDQIILHYVKNVIRGRWAEYEEALLHAPNMHITIPSIFMMQYAKTIIKGRWPEFEKILLTNNNYYSVIIKYAKMIIKGRWIEGERVLLEEYEKNVLLQDKRIWGTELARMFRYATDIIGVELLSQWKELVDLLKKYNYELPEGY